MSATKTALAVLLVLAVQPLTAGPAALNGILSSQDAVIISLTRPVEYKLSVLKDPARLIVDLPDAVLAAHQLDMKGNGAAVRRISSRRIKSGARVIIELKEMTPGQLSWDKGDLSIKFHPDPSLASVLPIETDLRDSLSERPAEESLKISGWLGDAEGRALGGSYLLQIQVEDAVTGESVWEKSQYVGARDGSFTGDLLVPRDIRAGLKSGLYKVKPLAPPPGTGWTIKTARPISRLGASGRLALGRN